MLVKIACPACGKGEIALEPKLMVQGASFSCNACGASLAATPTGQEDLKRGLEDYEQMQEKVAGLHAKGSNPQVG